MSYFKQCKTLKELKERRNDVLLSVNAEYEERRRELMNAEVVATTITGNMPHIFRVEEVRCCEECKPFELEIGQVPPSVIELTQSGLVRI